MNPYLFTLALALIATVALGIYLSHVRKMRRTPATPTVTHKTATFETSGAETVNQFNDMVTMATTLEHLKEEMSAFAILANEQEKRQHVPRIPDGSSREEIAAWRKRDDVAPFIRAKQDYQDAVMALIDRTRTVGADNYPFRWDVYRHIIASKTEVVDVLAGIAGAEPDSEDEGIPLEALRDIIRRTDHMAHTINERIAHPTTITQ